MSIDDPKILAVKTYTCPKCLKDWSWEEWAETSWFVEKTSLFCDFCGNLMTDEEKATVLGIKREPKVTSYPEMIPERIRDERKKYASDIVQSHRQGEMSQEFVEHYGDKLIDQVKDGVLSSDEIAKSKNVWGSDLPGITHQRGKYTKEEIVHRAREIERKRNR
jgi:hypothetical protein